MPSMRAVNEAAATLPEAAFTFQITFPTGGFWGVGMKPWDERKRSTPKILPEIQGKVAAIPGVQTFPIVPPALPGGGQFPVEFVLASTAETAEILGFAQQLQEKATKSGMFAFPPQIDVKLDQPQAEIEIDRDKVAELGLTLQSIGQDLGAALGGNFVNRFSIAGRSYKVIPQLARVDRLNPEQLKDVYVTGPNGQLVALSSIATLKDTVAPRSLNRFNQLNAVKISGVAMRPLDQALGVPRGRGRQDPAERLQDRLHGRVAAAAHRGEPLPARVPARGGADLPGARGAVQQLPGPVRHPGGLGPARHVRRAGGDLPQDAEPEHRRSSPTAGPPRSTSTRRWGS